MWSGVETEWLSIATLTGFALLLVWESLQPFFPFFGSSGKSVGKSRLMQVFS